MIKITSTGDFTRTHKFLKHLESWKVDAIMRKYAQQGVNALAQATPKDSGKTANSWSYSIETKNGKSTIYWNNDHINDGVNIALILQYGHGTGTGGYIQGRDYINPAMKSIFDKIAEEAWREVIKS